MFLDIVDVRQAKGEKDNSDCFQDKFKNPAGGCVCVHGRDNLQKVSKGILPSKQHLFQGVSNDGPHP